VTIAPGETFVIAAAGDIAGRFLQQDRTAALLLDLHRRRGLAAILPLGDLQYPLGMYTDYLADYDRAWGRPPLKALTRPVPGNHDYALGRSDAKGYFDYFNGRGVVHGAAGTRGIGYYSFDLGDWHLVALNTSDGCRRVSCAAGGPMHTWLQGDLARQGRRCVLAYFHHPRFQVGGVHGDDARVAPLWDALVDAGADLVLAGHEHNFQQLPPLDRAGRVDARAGIRSFVVGTGGATYYERTRQGPFDAEAVVMGEIGVLELELGSGTYTWRFLGARGAVPGRDRVLASGRGACRR
jgi:hypothetical protein